MSEPTGDGRQQPDPEKGTAPEGDRGAIDDQTQDVTPEPVFSDPTAPVWADPTTPIPPGPSAPTPPGPAHLEGDQPAAGPDSPAAQPAPPAGPPESNPYAQQPPVQPYGEPQPGQLQPGQQYPAYGQPQPGQPQPGQQYAAYGQPQPGQPHPQPGQQYPAYGQPYSTGSTTETNGSAIVLTILSGIIMLSTCFLIGIPSLIFGIMALSSNSTDPTGSRKKTKTGWIIFAINFAVVVLLAVAGFVLLIATGNNISDNSYNYN